MSNDIFLAAKSTSRANFSGGGDVMAGQVSMDTSSPIFAQLLMITTCDAFVVLFA